jgi:hypothetical protein
VESCFAAISDFGARMLVWSAMPGESNQKQLPQSREIVFLGGLFNITIKEIATSSIFKI